jgi:DNA-binding NtrC family response regulator
MKSILLVEDEAAVAKLLEEGLQRSLTLQIKVCTLLSEAIDYLKNNEVAVIITDLNLSDSNGGSTIKTLQCNAPDVPIIVLTGAGDGITYAKAIHLGAHDYLEKGHFSFPELVRCVLHAIERHRVRRMFVPINESIDQAECQLNDLKSMVSK